MRKIVTNVYLFFLICCCIYVTDKYLRVAGLTLMSHLIRTHYRVKRDFISIYNIQNTAITLLLSTVPSSMCAEVLQYKCFACVCVCRPTNLRWVVNLYDLILFTNLICSFRSLNCYLSISRENSALERMVRQHIDINGCGAVYATQYLR